MVISVKLSVQESDEGQGAERVGNEQWAKLSKCWMKFSLFQSEE